jgi:hypothetical protein
MVGDLISKCLSGHSWLDHSRKISLVPSQLCSITGCLRDAEVGRCVELMSSARWGQERSGVVYIAPMCGPCSKRPEVLEVKARVKLVAAHPC